MILLDNFLHERIQLKISKSKKYLPSIFSEFPLCKFNRSFTPRLPCSRVGKKKIRLSKELRYFPGKYFPRARRKKYKNVWNFHWNKNKKGVKRQEHKLFITGNCDSCPMFTWNKFVVHRNPCPKRIVSHGNPASPWLCLRFSNLSLALSLPVAAVRQTNSHCQPII